MAVALVTYFKIYTLQNANEYTDSAFLKGKDTGSIFVWGLTFF